VLVGGGTKTLIMSKADRAQKRLERAALAVGCLPGSIQWMEAALDPFPDEERVIAGYPDMVTGKSIVQAFKQKVTVSAPGTVNWDCQISFDGFFDAAPVNSTTFSANTALQTTQSATSYNLGGINVRTATAGTPLYVPTTVNAFCMDPVVSTTIPYRVIAMGLEIWNTTAPLYRQGNVVCWRQPRKVNDFGIIACATSAPLYADTKAYYYQKVPENATDALLLGGSKTWAAEKGCYCVGTLASSEIKIHGNSFVENYTALYAFSNSVNYFTPMVLAGTYPYALGNITDSSFNQFGAYFTGLSKETTLDVTWHYIIERFPRATDTDLVTMASNSCPYDPKALEIYSRTAWHLPVGVWVEENGLGDWICEVADVLQGFGVPGMGIVKGVTKGIQGISNSFDNHSGSASGGGGQSVQQVDRGGQAKAPKRERMNAKAKAKGKAPRQGPVMPNNKFNSTPKKKKKNAKK